jgi:hypothetical protein
MSKKCRVCNKSVYPNDPQINLDGTILHKPCAKCEDCQCQITLANFCKNETEGTFVLLCKTHYFKRFHEGGSYLGGEKFQVKNPRDALGHEVIGSSSAVVSSNSNILPSNDNDNDNSKLPIYKLKTSGSSPSASSNTPVKSMNLGDFSIDQLVNELEIRGYIVDLKKKGEAPPIPSFNPEENDIVDNSIDNNNNNNDITTSENISNSESNEEAAV